MDEGLRTIQLRPDWIGAVQIRLQNSVGMVLRNKGCIHSKSLIFTPLNLTENHLPFNSAKLRH